MTRRISPQEWARLQTCYDSASLRTRSSVGTRLPIPPPCKRIHMPPDASLLARTLLAVDLAVDAVCRDHGYALITCVNPRVATPELLEHLAYKYYHCELELRGNELHIDWQ